LDASVLERAVKATAIQRSKIELITTIGDDQIDDYDSLKSAVLDALLSVAGDKTPGYPLNLIHANNHAAIVADADFIVDVAIARLHMWLDMDEEIDQIIESGSLNIILCGLKDPSSVFIKDEPHPTRKVVDGRYRCISPVSLPDQLVESCLFTEYNKVLRRNKFMNGSAIGIGFTDKQNKEFLESVIRLNGQFGQPVSDDISGFDGLHTPQTLLATCDVDLWCVDGRPSWHRANRRWANLCAASTVVIGGILYSKADIGMLDSGSKDTSRRNTLLRSIYSHYICLVSHGTPAKATCSNGDDGLIWGVQDVESYLNAANASGIVVRDCKTSADTLEFCSHRYVYSEMNKAELLSWKKGIYAVITSPGKTESDIMQFVMETRWNPEHKRILKFARQFLDLLRSSA
jgi:hypothetical protein